MNRLSLGRTVLAGALVWGLAQSAAAQDAKGNISPQTKKINELIAKGWEDGGVKKTAAKASDHEFLRRVSIDLLGRIPTPEEVLDFEQDKSADKRVKLVQRLLHNEKYQPKVGGKVVMVPGTDGKAKPLTFDYTNEYAENWANLWTVWLMTRTGNALYRDQIRTWLEIQLSKNISHKDMVVALLTATGRTNENGAVNFIIHHLGDPIRDDAMTPANEPMRDGRFDAVPITSRVTKLFLGLQTQCTQCHDHPFNKEWVQGDFWGVNAFFRQTVRSATPTPAPGNGNNKMDNPVQITLTDEPELNKELIVYYERRDGRRIGSFPVMLKDLAQAEKGEKSGKMLAGPMGGKTRRQQLAEWVTAHDNFSKAFVNRIWGHLMGRGLNKEPGVDDFGSNNEVIHPELLAYLGTEFANYNYDPKRLLEWICTSDVYNLSSTAPKEFADPKFEITKVEPYFPRMALKAMSPEVMFESLMVATKAESRSNAEARKALRDAWMRKLVRNFGDDEGNELNFNGTVVQALLMMNGTELNSEIGVGGRGGKGNDANVVAEVVRKKGTPAAIYDELFLMTLSRHPTPAEIAKLEQVRMGQARVDVGAPPPPMPKGPNPKGPNPKGPNPPPAGGGTIFVPPAAPADVTFYQDVFWALLNTNEFILNH